MVNIHSNGLVYDFDGESLTSEVDGETYEVARVVYSPCKEYVTAHEVWEGELQEGLSTIHVGNFEDDEAIAQWLAAHLFG